MKTKYNFEKELINSRSIVDSVDKAHFREPVHLEFTVEDNDDFPNRGYDSQVIVDLSKSNYFILDLGKFNNYYEGLIQLVEEVLDANPEEWPEEDITDLPGIAAGDPTSTANIKFINYEDTQRFEILIIKREADVSINWTRPDQDVVFPFGDDKDHDFLEPAPYSQRIVSFRLGRSVNNFQQFIGIMTPWFSSKIYLDGEIEVISSTIGESYIGGNLDIYSEALLEDFGSPPKYLFNSSKIFSTKIDGNNKAFFNILRTYRPVVHISSNLDFEDGEPQDGPVGYLGHIIPTSAQQDINETLVIDRQGFFKYGLRMRSFRYGVMETSNLSILTQIEKEGESPITHSFPINASSSFKLRDLDYDMLREKLVEHFYTNNLEDPIPNTLGKYIVGEVYLFRRLYKIIWGEYVYGEWVEYPNGKYILQTPTGTWNRNSVFFEGDYYVYRKHEKDRETHLMCKTLHWGDPTFLKVSEPFVGTNWENYWEVIGDESQTFNYTDLYYVDYLSVSIEQPFFIEEELSPMRFNNLSFVVKSGTNLDTRLLEVGDVSSVHLTSQIERLYNIRGKRY